MKIKYSIGAICLVLLGIVLGFYLARYLWPPTKVIAMRFNPVGEMIVGAKKGDHLEWYSGPKKPIPVKFKFGLQPCLRGSDPAQGTCILKDSALYLFDCTAPGCQDPGVGGGDETLTTQGGPRFAALLDPPYATPKSVNLYCDPNTNTATADATVSGKKGDGFTVQVIGADDFTATFPANTCLPGDSLSYGSPTCRIQPTVGAETSYNYQITVKNCANPGTAILKETP